MGGWCSTPMHLWNVYGCLRVFEVFAKSANASTCRSAQFARKESCVIPFMCNSGAHEKECNDLMHRRAL